MFITLYAARIAYIISPMPVMSLIDPLICQSVRFVGLLHLGGTFMWGSCIAIFRVLYVTSQDFLKDKIGIGNLLMVMIIAGISEVVYD